MLSFMGSKNLPLKLLGQPELNMISKILLQFLLHLIHQLKISHSRTHIAWAGTGLTKLVPDQF